MFGVDTSFCVFFCYSFELFVLRFFFFKQKTAYEMRISDWSSDVCSSDLPTYRFLPLRMPAMPDSHFPLAAVVGADEIGRASCRERVCQTCRYRWSPYH